MRLSWDKAGERLYETGVDRGVFYPFTTGGKYGSGVAWNGLTAVNETPSGAEPTALWANNKKYLTLMSAEELGLKINAFLGRTQNLIHIRTNLKHVTALLN